MAETSGFFQAEWDDSLENPITEENTGWWDRSYVAAQFANYFKLFIGNGVFGSPTNQLLVSPGEGLSVVVSAGWAFINGMWYHNDSSKQIVIQTNSTASIRTDSIRVRFNDADRSITVLGFTGDTTLVRGSNIYDLELAQVAVSPLATAISAANITDRRTNEAVCGLVKGLMEVETTADLFAQYTAEFMEWFNDMKDQLSEDAAGHLQLEIDAINEQLVFATSSQISAIVGHTYS